jgi:hypothetical protein
MSNPKSLLDPGQIIQHAYDEAAQRIRVDSEATVVNADIDIQLDSTEDSVAIGDADGDLLEVNPDGSINVQAPDVETKLDEIKTEVQNAVNELQDINSELNNQTTLLSSLDGKDFATSAKQDIGNTSLASIDSKMNTLGQKTMANSMPVVIASDQTLNVQTQNPVVIAGTIDGQPNGTQYTVVNNIFEQILKTHDRDQALSYADFGTKDQRITQIDYTSPTFPGVTARKTITYTLVSGKYRRDNITRTIV